MEYQIKEINVSELKADKNQPRKVFDEEKLKEMSETFKTQGTIQPIEIDESKKIITGELRWRAAKLAGLKTIPCKILKGLSEEQVLERQLVENFNRQDMKINDVKEALFKFKKVNRFTFEEMSKRLGISERHLKTIFDIEENAPKILKNAVESGELEITKAREIMKAPKEEREELTREILEEEKIPIREKIIERIQEKKTLKELKEKQEEMKKTKENEVRVRTTEEAFQKLKSEIDDTTRRLQKTLAVVNGVRRIKKFYFFKPKEKERFFDFLEGTIDKFEIYLRGLRDLKNNIELEVIRE